MTRFASSAASLLALLALCATLGVAHGSGEPISKSTFARRVLGNKDLWLVEYMSPRCGTCQEMAPVWKQFVSANIHKVKFGQVNIDDDDGMALAQEQGVLDEGIPSIWAYDRSTGEATKVWGSYDVPTLQELEDSVFGGFLKAAPKGAGGFLAKTA
eukprot:CAMPEP_0197590340 /NCGR_PEP_ID=MMETSP1326-20131121/10963_1 /TAXON_ID=1155430 /ORGANISM="Genus nov. species nov., Strain RCC2288" /LENGTH=155 /DNA_ID=CAMNT_0043155359 /DNA_START=82 /DNA_END=549 /DNA_ORIENTATION=+